HRPCSCFPDGQGLAGREDGDVLSVGTEECSANVLPGLQDTHKPGAGCLPDLDLAASGGQQMATVAIEVETHYTLFVRVQGAIAAVEEAIQIVPLKVAPLWRTAREQGPSPLVVELLPGSVGKLDIEQVGVLLSLEPAFISLVLAFLGLVAGG